MENTAKLHRWVGIGVFLLTLGIYLKTMAPSVSFWDCGEFIACSFTMSVPHPPGSPLYVLLGRIFSLIPLSEVAWRINAMSALSSAIAVWCVYLSTVVLARRALGGKSLTPFGDSRDLSVLLGATVAALSLAFSYTQWFNATEAEVYGYSILFTCLGLWLILYWEGTPHGAGNDKWLLLIAYLFGLGAGLHMLCLLIIPTLLILAWFADEKLRRLILLLIGIGVLGGMSIALLGSGSSSNLAIGLGLAGLLYYLYGRDRRACFLLLGVLLLFVLGYSTYATLYIRSGLNPVIDENDPETFAAFIKFLNREQYGTESMLLSMLTPRSSRGYQFWDQQMKYFFQQFPFPVLERGVTFRKATEAVAQVVSISLVPYLLGLGGLLWHGRRDWRRFAAVAAMFLVMGFGLSLYLNMPDPQPRERHYVFSGMYLSFALWMGLGWTGTVEWFRRRFSLNEFLLAGVACIGLLLPAGLFGKLYHIEDRTGDYIAYDYAYNILQSCDEGSILFTNGDNDTFPLWFLQEVEGIRRDIRVVNLSLLNTGWYIKQLRDREPRIDIPIDDTFIDSVLTDTQLVDLYKRLWRQPKIPPEFKKMGLDVEVGVLPGHDLLRVQDMMVIGIIYWNEWKRPLHFAITIPTSNRLNLDPYLRMEGMTMKLVPEPGQGANVEKLESNLFEVYHFRNLNDPAVFKDENAMRLLGNYRACVLQLAESYQSEKRGTEMVKLMRWAENNTNFGWEGYYSGADFLESVDQRDLAAEFIENATNLLIDAYGKNEVANYDNIISLAGILLNEPYSEYDRAERLYRRAIDLQPRHWSAYFELAATLQAKGDAPGALQLLENYRSEYGENEKLVEAEKILHNSLDKRRTAAGDTAATP